MLGTVMVINGNRTCENLLQTVKDGVIIRGIAVNNSAEADSLEFMEAREK